VPGNQTALDHGYDLVIYNVPPLLQPPPAPPKNVPALPGVTYKKKTITITGRDFTAAAQVEINGRVIQKPFEFSLATNSLSIRLKPGKLNFIEGANQIVLIEDGERSQPHVLLW